ncbi:hypothetical protein SCB49_08077 [unidentified eubacterium SCB49]|nr:hypothetical protein SCB49_08077 [unidentified eubacterium SCB49]
MATFYIIYSKSTDLYYSGSCLDFETRIKEHNNHTYNNSFTARANDWYLFYKVDHIDYKTARAIEAHVKKNEK